MTKRLIVIIDFLENKINTTNGVDQQEWVKKYDIFTSRKLFEKYDRSEDLKKVDEIKKEIIIVER